MSKKEIDLNEECLGYNKAILVFNRDDGSNDFERAVHANKAFSLLWDIDQKCRSFLKYGQGANNPKQFIESIRDIIYEEDNILGSL